MKLKFTILALSATMLSSAYAQQFWKTNGTTGTWTGANWGTSAAGPFTTSYSSNSAVQFTADSTVTFASSSIGNITVADGKTVTISQAGTLSTNGAVRTFDVGTGSTLTWTGQSWSTVAGVGFIKNGAGTWNIGAQSNSLNATNGGFTLNAGTVIVSGNNSFGGSSSALTINGGTIQSSGTRTFANAITIGGNFTNSGTGNATFSGSVALGASTRTITNESSGNRIYSNVISGASGAGLTFNGSGSGITFLSGANTYSGATTIQAGTVALGLNGTIANSTSIVVGNAGSSGAILDTTAKTGFTVSSTQTLSGIGTVNVGGSNTLTISGQHSPGNAGTSGGVGTQAVTGSLSYGANSIFNWDLNENSITTGFDKVTATGTIGANATSAVFNVVLGTGVTQNAAFWTVPGSKKIWSLATIFGQALTSTFSSVTVTNATPELAALGGFTINGTNLTWTAVPEPSSALAGLLLGAGLLRRRRSA